MPIITAVTYGIQAIELATTLAASLQAAGAKMKQFEAEKRDPTQAEWDALNAQITALRAELHKGA